MQNHKKKIGFIGLGVMGKPMSLNLLKSGYLLMVYDINREAVKQLVSQGAEQGNSPKHVAENCEIIITMLPNSPQVEEVILGENGVLEGAKKGTIVIDMSSISPVVSQKIYDKVILKGVEMMDAPVSGGEPKAIDGTLSIMAGGKEDVFAEVKDILLVMGASAI